MANTITMRDARKDDAPQIAAMIMEAMRPECCQHFYGDNHSSEEFHALMTALVERDDTQYSYLNTICATNDADSIVGILVCYDGARLLQLRQPFIDGVKERFGRDFSHMPEETEAGELYLDSADVVESMRRQGIARQLFEAASKRAESMGIGHLGLLVDRDNPDAERLYLRMGFRHVGDRDWGGHNLKHMQKAIGTIKA